MIRHASRSIHSGFETVLFKVAFLRTVLSSLYWYTLFSCSLQDYGLSLLRFVFMYKIDLSGGSEKPEFVDRS